MGVPKFFRYMSERYPCLSEVIKEYQIPEFDNLYLDMNGIIHNCSHPNDNDPHFRISEKQIFQDIFHYIEILFRMIQPKHLFFMAIDGVAPRAKMNQQRGRRFRSAKEMETLEEKAKEKGEVLPTEKRFDSNCITPGTPFMCRLHQQLRYFVKLKMSTDKLWRNVKVILSGHETPGEGEHKIMDYIRFMKSKPDYNPNMRHCLYGLDADLIMLGLCTHEPYFSLLREEVKFNTKSNKGGSQILTPEETKFFLLHLSLMRDYLELEFSKLKAPGVLKFPFNIENIVDDWVLMGFLIGNDFIPNLPDLHIINGALPLMYKVYEEVLPTLEGYINEAGQLNLKRFEKFMKKLASFDFEQFREKYADIQYLESKTGKKFSDVFHKKDNDPKDIDPDLAALIKATDDDFDCDNGEEEVLNYSDYEEYYYSDEDNEWRSNFFSEFSQHKTDYYRYKLDYEKVTNDVLRDQAKCYIRAIQWNLHYYYNGCVSWSWYYPHHYAPYISDIKDFSDMNLTFEMGEPFLPFQQLLAVLPAASKELLPKPYQDLMTLESSDIVDYYPTEFQTDLNGKKQDWEAVVLIPFIDEKRLIDAMDEVEFLLTNEERARNTHGPMLVYTYTNEHLGMWEAPEHFPSIQENHALENPLWRTEIYVYPSKLNKGLCRNVNMNLYRTHFPTLKHLKFSHKIEAAKVKVFQQPSRGDSVILSLENNDQTNLKQVADKIIGRNIYINYPHPVEIKVLAVSSREQRISLDRNNGPIVEKSNKDISERFKLSNNSITEDHFTKLGIRIGKTEILVFGQPVEGRKYFFGSQGNVSQQRTYIKTTVVYAFQTIIWNLHRSMEASKYKNIDEIFYPGCQCFTLSNPHYGSDGTVISTVKDENSFVKLSLKVQQEPDLSDLLHMKDKNNYIYMPAYTVASKLSISPLLLSRFTGAIFILASAEDNAKKHNIGLNIKFSRKNEEVVGFTRRDELTKKWFYTEKVVELIKDYMKKFPEVFNFLKDHSSDDIYFRDDVFPQNGVERVTEIVSWLKEQPHSKAEVRSCGASIVDDKIVQLIEQCTDACDKTEKRMTLLVKPNKLYIPKSTLDKVCPDPDTKFELFDRVVNIRDSYTVPLGYRGTIIGITQGETHYDTTCDVVFDKSFPHGVKIRCSEFRGYRMPAQGMINLSYGERLNGNNNTFRKNAVKSKEKNSSYSNALKHNSYEKVSNNFYKENSTPPQSPLQSKFSRSNSQQASPYGVKNLRVSQQSSDTISRESPENIMISQQSSPYLTNTNLRRNIKSPLQNNENISSELFGTSVTIDNKNIHKPIDKENRRIFSISTFPTPEAQKSELPAGGMSFFGHPNLLDIPETKNKLFTSDLGILKTEPTESCETEQGSNIVTHKSTSLNLLDNTKIKSVENKLLSNTSNLTDTSGQHFTSKTSGNSVNIIPSISQIVQQNNFTAKTDFQSIESPFKDIIYSKPSSCQPKNINSCKPNESRLSASLSQLLFKNNSLYQNSSDISTTAISNEAQFKNDDFERAVTALALQSPLLLEEKRNEASQNTFDLSFDEKHGIVADNKVPTITTAIRKVTTSLPGDIEDEEEEVMTIEIEETTKQLNKTGDSNKGNISAPVDQVQAFFANLNINKSDLPSNPLENIQPLKNIESNGSNVSDMTANTIHDFLANAAAVRRKQLDAEGENETKEHDVPKTDQQNKMKGVARASHESSADVNDLLKKMLNINTIGQENKSVNDTLRSETHSLTSNNPETVNVVRQKTPSAFTLVKPSSTVAASKETFPLEQQEHVQPSSAKLRPLATPFIPSQVQKRLPSQATSSSLEPQRAGFPQQSQLNFPQHQPDGKLVPGNSNPPGFYPNVYPSQHTREQNAYLRRDMTTHPRGIPILGSQPNVYNNQPALPPQYYYPNQPNYQQMYYSGVPLQQFPQSTKVQQGLHTVQQTQQYNMQQPSHPSQISGHMPLQTNLPRPFPQTKQNFWPTQSGFQQNTAAPSSQFLPYAQLDISQQFTLTQPPSSAYAQPASNFVQAPPQQYSAPNFNQMSKSQINNAPKHQSQTATLSNRQEFGSSISVVEDRTDSFILKLLKLTQVHKLGVPQYTYEVDDKKWFTATVRIAHDYSDIFFKGKPCPDKSDSAEICARRAYSELSHTYPVPAKPTTKVLPTPNNNPALQTEQSHSLQNKTSETPINADETKPMLKKAKKSVMAAKFDVPFKSSK